MRNVEDEALLIILIRIFGKGFNALVDGGASRSFIFLFAIDIA